MIVAPVDGGLRLITQPDHAALAGRVMGEWRAGGLPTHPRRESILRAVAAHDDGWLEVDAARASARGVARDAGPDGDRAETERLHRDRYVAAELVYLAGGVIRRGFVDVTRASTRRDLQGRVINTFIRHVRRMPPKGTRYLAGELLSAVIRLR